MLSHQPQALRPIIIQTCVIILVQKVIPKARPLRPSISPKTFTSITCFKGLGTPQLASAESGFQVLFGFNCAEVGSTKHLEFEI